MTSMIIKITRGEGLIEECGILKVVNSFEEADNVLRKMSVTVREGGGSDKVDFTCVWSDGAEDDEDDEYTGTFLLRHWKEESPSLYRHMKGHLDHCCMTAKPKDMSGPNWDMYQKYYAPYAEESRGLLDRRFS